VIPLGLRLVVSGGREAITRLVILAVAVGLGVGLLLTAVAATNAVSTWNSRHAWFWTGTAAVPPGPAPAGTAPLWWRPGSDIFDGQQISRFDVAATGASSPVPPGIAQDPGPGQYYASPALAALLRSTPANQLAGRYPGHLAGTIGDAALPSPNSLVIIVGRTPAQLAHTPNSVQVTSISTTPGGGPGSRMMANPQGLNYTPPDGGAPASATDLILSVVALAILAPVLIFIVTATRLSAARREERFAAMRLAGATRGQVSLLAATESTAAAILGVAAGFGIFFLLRTPVAGIPFIGAPFFPGELTLSCRTSSWSRSACRRPPPWQHGWRCAGCASPRSASPAGRRRRRREPREWCRCWPALPNSPSGPSTATRHPFPGRSRRSCPASR
jgi:FtsX-like permease family protein